RPEELGLPADDVELDVQTEGRLHDTLDRGELEDKTIHELLEMAQAANIEGAATLDGNDLVTAILSQRAEQAGFLYRQGGLDVLPDGSGFLRPEGFLPSEEDVYVSMSQIRRFGLRRGDEVSGLIRPPKDSERYYALLRIEVVNGLDPDAARKRPV